MGKKISMAVMVMAALVIIAAVTIILAVQSSQETTLPKEPDTLTLSTIPTLASSRIITPAINHTTVTSRATTAITDSSLKKDIDECDIVPDESGFRYYNATVFNAVTVEKYSFPVRIKDPVITTEQAKEIAKKAIPQYSPDRVDMNFSDGSVNVRAYYFTLYQDDQGVIAGSLNADTGDLMGYSVNQRVMATQGNSNAITTLDSAQVIAGKEIQERNGKIPLKMVNSRLENGKYIFLYKRIIQGFPCAGDGITISCDPGTGQIIDYFKSWSTPENAVAALTVPAISRDEAIAVVERKAKVCYPESADSFRIVSANLQWMDFYDRDKFTPKPGVIPLGWYIWFDDRTIRNMEFPVPAEGWVDAQNGTLLSLNYYHNH